MRPRKHILMIICVHHIGVWRLALCFCQTKMSTRSNLYKNPSFAYRRSYSLSSVLQNLQSNFVIFVPFSFSNNPNANLTNQHQIVDANCSSDVFSLPAYNTVTGNTPPTNESPVTAADDSTPRPKRRRQQQPLKPQQVVVEDDRPLSHQDYIHLRR